MYLIILIFSTINVTCVKTNKSKTKEGFIELNVPKNSFSNNPIDIPKEEELAIANEFIDTFKEIFDTGKLDENLIIDKNDRDLNTIIKRIFKNINANQWEDLLLSGASEKVKKIWTKLSSNENSETAKYFSKYFDITEDIVVEKVKILRLNILICFIEFFEQKQIASVIKGILNEKIAIMKRHSLYDLTLIGYIIFIEELESDVHFSKLKTSDLKNIKIFHDLNLGKQSIDLAIKYLQTFKIDNLNNFIDLYQSFYKSKY